MRVADQLAGSRASGAQRAVPADGVRAEAVRHACVPEGRWKLLARMLLRSAGRRLPRP